MDQVSYDRLVSYLTGDSVSLTWRQRGSLLWDSRNYVVQRGQLLYKGNLKVDIMDVGNVKEFLPSVRSFSRPG